MTVPRLVSSLGFARFLRCGQITTRASIRAVLLHPSQQGHQLVPLRRLRSTRLLLNMPEHLPDLHRRFRSTELDRSRSPMPPRTPWPTLPAGPPPPTPISTPSTTLPSAPDSLAGAALPSEPSGEPKASAAAGPRVSVTTSPSASMPSVKAKAKIRARGWRIEVTIRPLDD